MVLALPLKSFPSAFLSPKLGNTFDNTKIDFVYFIKVPIAGFRIVHFPQGGSKTIGGCNLYLIVRCCIIFVDAICNFLFREREEYQSTNYLQRLEYGLPL